jgi:hypothetical protein
MVYGEYPYGQKRKKRHEKKQVDSGRGHLHGDLRGCRGGGRFARRFAHTELPGNPFFEGS